MAVDGGWDKADFPFLVESNLIIQTIWPNPTLTGTGYQLSNMLGRFSESLTGGMQSQGFRSVLMIMWHHECVHVTT